LRRGEMYRVRQPGRGDPRPARVFVVVSRAEFLNSVYSTAVCVPIYSTHEGLATQVPVDESHGLKRPSAARCDEVTSLPRAWLTDYVGSLPPGSLRAIDRALVVALELGDAFDVDE